MLLAGGRSKQLDAHAGRPLYEARADALRVYRFLRELRVYRARRDDVYISSYPRSGTTWMQLLVHLVRGGDMSFSHIAEVVPWFERSFSLGRATAADFARLEGMRAFKSHLPHVWLPRGARYLYVHRDGRDVVLSYYHFYRSHLGFEGSFDTFFERFLRGDLQYGSWFRHVADWQRVAARANVCVLSYEALQRDPESGIDAIARLCGVTLSAPRTAEILDCASFAAMKRQEDKFDHALSEPHTSAPRGAFVRQGHVGGHREHLSSAQLARFEEARAMEAPRRLPELRLAAFLH